MGRYALLFVGLTAVFYLMLYLAGLLPQEKVFENFRRSAPQFSAEGAYPYILWEDDDSYRFDNWTDARILMHSLYLDTKADPASILTCPAWTATPTEDLESMLSQNPVPNLLLLSEMDSVPAANSLYLRYCMGFRAVIRLLLTFVSYPEIRQIILWTVILLFTLVTGSLARKMGMFESALFAGFFLSMNPIAVCSSPQYACCFVLAFMGTLAVLHLPAAQNDPSMLLFVLGACTQYFDFYTAPVLTFLLPLGIYLLMEQRQGRSLRIGEMLKHAGKGLLAWGTAYVFTWLVKLLLTDLLTGQAAWSSGTGAFLNRVGISGFSSLVKTAATVLWALYRNLGLLLSPVSAIFFATVFLLWLVGLVRSKNRKEVLAETLGYAVLALLPILWLAGSAAPAIHHAFFQYRTLGGSVFLACCAAAQSISSVRRDRSDRLSG